MQHTLASLGNDVYVSAASVWEIAQKRAAKKLSFTGEIAVAMERHDFRELPMRGAHCEVAAARPRYHKDPFDRLLIAQARVEGLILVTHDEAMTSYDVPLLRVRS